MLFIKWLNLFCVLEFGGGGGSGDGGAAQQAADEARKQGLRDQVNTLFGSGGTVPPEFQQEEQSLGDSLRSQYTDQGILAYQNAERQLRFGAANTGNIGGTAYADAQSKLDADNAMGGTRIEQAVQQAINGLRAARENTRLNSIQLVNSGSGPDAVNAAATGLKEAAANANSQSTQNIFGDLFKNLSFTNQVSNAGSQNAALAALYGQPKSVSTLAPTDSTGRTINY